MIKITISSRKSRNPSSILGVHIVLLVPWSLVIDLVCVKSSHSLKDKMAGRGLAQVSKNSAQIITQVTSTKTLGKSRISSGLNEFEQAKTQSEASEETLFEQAWHSRKSASPVGQAWTSFIVAVCKEAIGSRTSIWQAPLNTGKVKVFSYFDAEFVYFITLLFLSCYIVNS